MKIVLLASGNDIHSVKWANQLAANGNDVYLFYVKNQKPSIHSFNKKVNLFELKFSAPLGYFFNYFQVKNLIQKIQPDILNAHYASGYGTLGRLIKFKPFILSVYGSDVYDFPFKSKFNMQIIRKNLKSANQICSTSNAMARKIVSLLGIDLTEVHITPFGVDLVKFKNTNNNKTKEKIIIGSIKKLSPKYGMEYGILAINFLIKNLLTAKKNIYIEYRIYGIGEDRKKLEQLVVNLGLNNVIKFMGRVSNDFVPTVLNDFDIFLGNSILDSESFGVAIVEAMACEVPVIVTDVDGFKEVVDNGNFGIIVPRRDPISMAKEILNLIENPDLRRDMGIKGRIRVTQLYNWIENVKNMEKIYFETIEKNNAFK
jgi:glycosyltransferase involved in cell wall biosynthesis